jgi:hypothetical protein
MTRALSALAITLTCCASLAHSATITIYLLDAQNRPLGHGKAMIFAFLEDENRKEYVGYIPELRVYRMQLPDTAVIDLEIYLAQETIRKEVRGLSGTHNQTLYLHLRTDRQKVHVYYLPVPGAPAPAPTYATPNDYADLVDDLDRLYPNGTPRQLTNIRTFLRDNVLSALDNAAAPDDPSLRDQKQQFRSRVVRHLQP